MSLKDRFNTSNSSIAGRDEEPKYYESDMIAKQISLGVLDEILLDDEISSLCVNGAKNIFIEKKGVITKSQKTFRDNIQLLNILLKNAKDSGKVLDENHPMITFNHKQGVNIVATIPPLSSTVCVYIDCYYDKFANLNLMQDQGIISKEIALVLEVISGLKNNIIIAGEQNSMKTTLLSALAKKAPEQNSRNVFIDYDNELKIDSSRYSNYDFTIIEKDKEYSLLDTIIASNPDRLCVNLKDEKTLAYLVDKLQDGYEGLITTICAKSKIEALNKLIYIFLKSCPYLSYEKARETIYNYFDMIIFTASDKEGRRIESISQIENNKVEDIFTYRYKEYNSTGLIPEFFEKIRLNSPINVGVFDRYYKHTSNNTLKKPEQKTPNLEAIKKLKKDLQEQTMTLPKEDYSNLNNDTKITPDEINDLDDIEIAQDDFENLSLGSPEENAIKKAKEKLDMLKRNAKNQENYNGF